MAATTLPEVTPSIILCLQPDDRKKILLASLREGYPCVPKVSRPVSSKVSRYVSQFTSGRWREKIWFSDDSNASEDMQCETPTPEPEASCRLVIFGYDLHSEDYLKEREMIARWNIVERELHFPDLEKGYVQKRDAKTQSDVGFLESCRTPTARDVNIVREPTTEDIPMEEGQESPQKATEDIETLTKIGGQESSIRNERSESQAQELAGDIKVSAEVFKQASSCSVQESKSLNLILNASEGIETLPLQETADTNSESSVPLKENEPGEKITVQDSEVDRISGTEYKAVLPEETSLGKESDSNSESSDLSKESEDRKEVLNVHDLKLAESCGMETSTESGDKISVPKSQFLAALEVKESIDKMEDENVLEDSNVSSSEKAMETSETTSTDLSNEKVTVLHTETSDVLEVKEPADKLDDETVPERSEVSQTSETDLETSETTSTELSNEKVTVLNTETSDVLEVMDPADKMDDETVPERSEVSKTSETDLETSETTFRGKRKADSISEDDPDEKRTKKSFDE